MAEGMQALGSERILIGMVFKPCWQILSRGKWSFKIRFGFGLESLPGDSGIWGRRCK